MRHRMDSRPRARERPLGRSQAGGAPRRVQRRQGGCERHAPTPAALGSPRRRACEAPPCIRDTESRARRLPRSQRRRGTRTRRDPSRPRRHAGDNSSAWEQRLPYTAPRERRGKAGSGTRPRTPVGGASSSVCLRACQRNLGAERIAATAPPALGRQAGRRRLEPPRPFLALGQEVLRHGIDSGSSSHQGHHGVELDRGPRGPPELEAVIRPGRVDHLATAGLNPVHRRHVIGVARQENRHVVRILARE